ncbi:DUF1269 domain-containing protein [Listeria grandensis]|uniref:DUF1269 domain-containing protein n=1 Tax=Listeria grandensis TaxID=1494963 RepID=A0A7X0Y2Q4_9LIST|nr:DUF1269 domain-containing protein [Listeria grandensis]MBC1474358.1 DUF1269 domain-containing protein [Listeria grandensis]MBC1935901.1 DUF1269 domain-containing protein [Listeria grandensis]MBC6316424.1 DUF1269 domain-containing protein [Listeria grandensis]
MSKQTNKTVLIMNFETESKSYQAFSEIKTLHTERKIRGEQMAVVEHDHNHKINAKDFLDFTGGDKNMKGSLIGMLVGILGGPLGVLLGWMTGAIIGSTQDAKEIRDAMNVFEKTLETIPEDQTGVILIAEEEHNEYINDLVNNKLGGRVIRMDEALVSHEINEAKQAEKEAQTSAKKRWFNKKED